MINNILELYYKKIINYNLINKFFYKNIKKIPKIKYLILNFGCKNFELKKLAPAFFAIELITDKKGKLIKSKKSNLLLKIKKGQPVSCKIILKNKNLYIFLLKVLANIFPLTKNFKKITIKKNNKNKSSLSFTIKDLSYFYELNTNFNLFTKLPNLNITILTNTTTKYELIYLLKSFKIPIYLKKAIVTQLVECNLAKIKDKSSNLFIC